MNLSKKLMVAFLFTSLSLQADVKVENDNQITVQTSAVKKTDSLVAQNTKTVKNVVIETSYDALRDCLAFCGVEAMALFNEICSLNHKMFIAFCCASLGALKCKLKNK